MLNASLSLSFAGFFYKSSESFQALSQMINSLTENECPVLLVGDRGIGKTSLINDRLKTSCAGDIGDVYSLSVYCNRFDLENSFDLR